MNGSQYLLYGALPCENVSSGICGQRRPRSACAHAQSDQGLQSANRIIGSLGTTECMTGEQMDDTLRMRRMI